MKTGFTPDELALGYTEWKRLENECRKHLAPNVRQWLGQWNLWDLACSPMDDNERRHIRYGHYLGWRHHEEMTPKPGDEGSLFMINHVGFEPPKLCECGERYQRRDGLCWSCWTAALDRRAEERSERERLEKIERGEAND